jgi:unsaturated rhamnogalacturonyl hydrolase
MKITTIPAIVLMTLSSFAHGAPSATDFAQRSIGFGAVPDYPLPYQLPSEAAVLADLESIFNYTRSATTLKVFDNATGDPILDPSAITNTAVVDMRFGESNTWAYTNGVTIAGFDLLADITGDVRFLQYNRDFFDFTFTWMPAFTERENRTGIGSAYTKAIKLHALDHCGSMTAALIKTHRRFPDDRYLRHIKFVDQYIAHGQFRLPDGTLGRERPQAVSLWTDDYYMCIPFLAQMAVLTGDNAYFDDAILQVLQLAERLFDWNQELFDHGWSEVSHPYDPKHYWARANGWAMMAMVELLTVLPADYPKRDAVLHLYRTHVKGIVERQAGDGLWHNMLNRESTYTETSASAMFTFSIARGIQEGWLPALYAPVVITGWNGISERILPDGRVSGICEGTTYANDFVYYAHRGAGEHTSFFGAVVLAGAETLRLLRNPSVELLNTRPYAVNSALHGKPAPGGQATTQ